MLSHDDTIIRALQQFIRIAGVHQRVCLIGGHALRDCYLALKMRLGSDIPAVRASADLDLLITVGSSVEADQALATLLREHWSPKPGRPATYIWSEDPQVELDLATIYDEDEPPARAMKISRSGSGRIMAYRMIPAWLHSLNLMEPCHDQQLRSIGLERLRQTALVLSKFLAVDACVRALAEPAPPLWTRRLERDLTDILYLTDRRLSAGLWCAASSSKRAEIQLRLAPCLERLAEAATQAPGVMSSEAHDRLRTVLDGLPAWWDR